MSEVNKRLFEPRISRWDGHLRDPSAGRLSDPLPGRWAAIDTRMSNFLNQCCLEHRCLVVLFFMAFHVLKLLTIVDVPRSF